MKYVLRSSACISMLDKSVQQCVSNPSLIHDIVYYTRVIGAKQNVLEK